MKSSSTILRGEIPAYASGDPRRGVLDGIASKVSVSGGRLHLRVTLTLADPAVTSGQAVGVRFTNQGATDPNSDRSIKDLAGNAAVAFGPFTARHGAPPSTTPRPPSGGGRQPAGGARVAVRARTCRPTPASG